MAHESATRQIIQNTISKMGPKINSFLSLSGVIEVVVSQSRDFDPQITAQHPFGKVGPAKDRLDLGTVELDFDIKASEWLTGALVITWESGSPSQSQLGAHCFQPRSEPPQPSTASRWIGPTLASAI